MVKPGIIILYLMVKTMVKHGKTGVNIEKTMVYTIYNWCNYSFFLYHPIYQYTRPGKHTKNELDRSTMLLAGKSTISMGHFQ